MSTKRSLFLVVPSGIKKLSQREELIAAGQKLFPQSESMVAKWVDAKLACAHAHAAGRKFDIRIGDGRETKTTFPRTRREAGIHNEESRIPRFFRRLFKESA